MFYQGITFHQIGTTSFTATNVANPTGLTPGLPSPHVDRVLMMLYTWSRSNTATVATPAGWTALAGFPLRSGTTSGGTFYAFARISTPADSAPTVTWTGLTTGTSGDSSGAVIAQYQNACLDPVNCIDGTPAASDQSASTTTLTIPAITTTYQGSGRVAIALKLLETAGTWTPPTGFNERLDAATASGTGHTIEIAESGASPGSQGSTTAAPSVTTTSRALGVSFGLRGGNIRQPAIIYNDPAVFC